MVVLNDENIAIVNNDCSNKIWNIFSSTKNLGFYVLFEIFKVKTGAFIIPVVIYFYTVNAIIFPHAMRQGWRKSRTS